MKLSIKVAKTIQIVGKSFDANDFRTLLGCSILTG